jgi:hypothetical protein
MRIRGDIRQQKSVLCSVLCRIARSQFCWFGNTKPKIFFYCHGVGKITYDRFFWKTVTLTASVKAEQNLLSCNSPLCSIAQSQFLASNLIEHLREFEFICKTVLAHESGDPKVQFNEKNWGSKSCETFPLIDGCYPLIRHWIVATRDPDTRFLSSGFFLSNTFPWAPDNMG